MFETQEFRNQINNILADEAIKLNVTYADRDTITNTLQQAAAPQDSSPDDSVAVIRGVFTWNQKTASIPLSHDDIIDISVRRIIKTASSLAQNNRRSQITQNDINQSLQINFCKIWPFCRGDQT